MNNDILKFIQRFPIYDEKTGAESIDDWMGHNDYYFARILKTRFKGEIWYNLVNCHFLFRYFDNFYDWSGLRAEYDLNEPDTMDNMIQWSKLKKFDRSRYERICRDVIE